MPHLMREDKRMKRLAEKRLTHPSEPPAQEPGCNLLRSHRPEVCAAKKFWSVPSN
jgi:hypothetical protein